MSLNPYPQKFCFFYYTGTCYSLCLSSGFKSLHLLISYLGDTSSTPLFPCKELGCDIVFFLVCAQRVEMKRLVVRSLRELGTLVTHFLVVDHKAVVEERISLLLSRFH